MVDTIIILATVFAIFFFLWKLMSSKPKCMREGLSVIGVDDYDYLAPIPPDSVSTAKWQKLVDKLKSISPKVFAILTVDKLKQQMGNYITEPEIDYYEVNGYFPYDPYVSTYITDSFKKNYNGSPNDLDSNMNTFLVDIQKNLPNRYYYEQNISQLDAVKSPKPDAYLIFTGEKPSPNPPPPKTPEPTPEKEPEEEGPDGSFQNYGIEVVSKILTLFLHTIIGVAVLYSVKVSQSNLMPTNGNCEPFIPTSLYTSTKETATINTDIVKLKWFGGDINPLWSEQTPENVFSTKIQFPYDKNIDIIKNHSVFGIGDFQKKEKDTVFTNYRYSVMEKMITNFAGNMNAANNIMNSVFSESVILFVGPSIYSFLIFILVWVNVIYGWIYYMMNVSHLFSKPAKDDTNKLDFWDNDNIQTGWFWYIIYLWIAFCCSGIALVGISIFAVINAFKMLFLPLVMMAEVVTPTQGQGTEKTPETYSIKNMLKNVMLFKKSLFMYIISYYVVIGAQNHMGGIGLVFSILGCIFAYWFIPDIYRKFVPDSESYPNSTHGLASYTTAQKVCEKIQVESTINGVSLNEKIDAETEGDMNSMGISSDEQPSAPPFQPSAPPEIQVDVPIVEETVEKTVKSPDVVIPSAPLLTKGGGRKSITKKFRKLPEVVDPM